MSKQEPMTQQEKQEINRLMNESGIYLSDFISSSTYGAVEALIYRIKYGTVCAKCGGTGILGIGYMAISCDCKLQKNLTL